MRFDILKSHHYHKRAQDVMDAAYHGAYGLGLDVRWMAPEPRKDAYVVLYGLGGVDRLRFANRKRLIAFDAGYWDRHGDDRRFRVSVGGFHCPQFVLAGERPGPDRFLSSKLRVSNTGGNPKGPIVLVGIGPKSNSVGAMGWNAAKAREIRKVFPGRQLLYRPKPKKSIEPGVVHDGIAGGDIDDVVRGASLVVCRHSNVAIDACRLGVPVVCEDGAGASIYPSRLKWWQDQPTFEQRHELLHRLAYWQWSVQECRTGEFWRWIVEMLGEIHGPVPA